MTREAAEIVTDEPAGGPVLVTGGAGFIGTSLVTTLRNAGTPVTVVDLRPFPDPEVRSVTGDLRDQRIIDAAFDLRPSAVFHLAARTSVLQSVHDPAEVFDINVGVTQRLLEAARRSGVSTFVLASTNAVVGAATTGRIDECSVLQPLTPYGATKAAAEMLCSAYSSSYGIAAGCIRLTNVYGPGMGAKDSFIARLLRAASSGTEVSIYGDGQQERDYLFVDDAIAGLLLAWQHRLTTPLVIGSGVSTSVLDVYELARAVTGRQLPSTRIEGPRGEMRAVRVDIARARSLGYEARVGLRDGLARTWAALLPELENVGTNPP